ncbi:MAG: 1-acyl-sn-glycerol-3-phosphate acyltransferase [Deltaproteobacteria bacterium]|nr:1-acyl-sn-glycerol-3-phosphate acyltransferase [Deltaproteobacteria bacterium]
MAILVGGLLYMLRTWQEINIKSTIARFARWVLSLRYCVEVVGLDRIEKIENQGTLFLPNHPALIDPLILMSILYAKFQPRSLSDEDQASKPVVRQVMKLINPIIIPQTARNGRRYKQKVLQALQEVTGSLKRGEEIVVYPSGKLYHTNREILGTNSGIEYILKHAPESRVILIRTTGLWGSSYSKAKTNDPSIVFSAKRVFIFLLANMIFWGPRRKVAVELIEDNTIKSLGHRTKINTYLERFYNKIPEENSSIPYYWWQKSSSHKKKPESRQLLGDTRNHRKTSAVTKT